MRVNILLKVEQVAPGFEPATYRSRNRHANHSAPRLTMHRAYGHKSNQPPRSSTAITGATLPSCTRTLLSTNISRKRWIAAMSDNSALVQRTVRLDVLSRVNMAYNTSRHVMSADSTRLDRGRHCLRLFTLSEELYVIMYCTVDWKYDAITYHYTTKTMHAKTATKHTWKVSLHSHRNLGCLLSSLSVSV